MPEFLSAQNQHGCLSVTSDYSTPGKLRLRYSVQNSSEAALYICNQFYLLDQVDSLAGLEQFKLSAVQAYILVTEKGVSVRKSSTDLSFHDGIKVVDIPLLTRVEPGQQFEQTLELDLPLLPYKVNGTYPAEQPATDFPLYFELGYFVGTAQIQEGLREVTTAAGPSWQLAWQLSSYQQQLAVGPFKQPAPVLNGQGNGTRKPVSDAEWTPWG